MDVLAGSSERTSPIATSPADIGFEECVCNSITNSPDDSKPFLEKSFGCGICGEMLYIEKEFQKHCSGHRFSPSDNLFLDIC